MAYLRQQLLEVCAPSVSLTTISITVVVGVPRRRQVPFQVPASFADDDISLEHRGGVLKMNVLRHQIETLRSLCGVGNSEKICPPLLFTKLIPAARKPDVITPAR